VLVFEVILERRKGEQWTLLRTARTNCSRPRSRSYPEGTPLEKEPIGITFSRQ